MGQQKIESFSKLSIIQNIKSRKNQARLFNYVLGELAIFREPLASIMVSIGGVMEIVIAMIIMQICSVENNSNSLITLRLEKLFQNIRVIVKGNQITIQPLIILLCISTYFLHNSSVDNDVQYYSEMVVATINLLMVIIFGGFASNLYFSETTFINNALAREISYAPLINLLQKVLLMVTLFAAGLDNDDFSSTQIAVTLVPFNAALAFVALVFIVLKTRTLSLAKIINCACHIMVACILLLTFVFQGQVFTKCDSFFTLIWYFLLLSIFYMAGFYFMFRYIEQKKFEVLYNIKVSDEPKWIDGLVIAFEKLKCLERSDMRSSYLSDLVMLLDTHYRFCKDKECVCKLKNTYLGKIHKLQNEKEGEELLQQAPMDNIIQMSHESSDDIAKSLFIEFIINFLIMMTKKALIQYPKSLELANIGIQIIALSNNRRTMIAQFLIINLNNKSYNIASKMKYMQLQYLIQQHFTAKNSSDSHIDPDNLIYHHILQKELKDTLSQLSDEILQFWAYIKNKQQSIEQISAQQNSFANIIIKVQMLFQQLEESSQDKLYTYYIQSILHKLLFNDSASGLNYLKKLQSHNNINRMFKKLENGDVPELSFIIVDSQNNNVGKILAANKTISNMLGYDVGELEKNRNIDIVIPKNIKKLHSLMIKNMMITGNGGQKFTANGSDVFVAKNNGYIMQMNVKMSLVYSKQYELVYLMILQKINKTKLEDKMDEISLRETMVFLCEEKGLQVSSITQSCYRQLKLEPTLSNATSGNIKSEYLSLYDIIEDENFLDSFESNSILEYATQKSEIKQDMIHITRYQANKLDNQDLKVSCTIHLRRQLIYFDKVKQQPYYQVSAYIFNIQQNEIMGFNNSPANTNFAEKNQFQHFSEDIQQQLVGLQMEEDDNSSQDSTHTSSASSFEQSPENIKHFITISTKISSRSLGIVFKLVIFLFLVMLCIGVINLTLTINRHEVQNEEIQIVKLSYDRVNYHAKVRVLLQNLVNIANGYESTSSSYEQDRVGLIKSVLTGYVQNIKDIQDYLDVISNQETFSFEISKKYVTVQTLDNNFNIITNEQTYSVAYHLFLTNMITILNMNLTAMAGDTDVQKIVWTKTNRIPTDNEKLTNFVVYNSFGDVIVRNYQEAEEYTIQSKQHAIDAKNNNLVTTIISVISIFVVGCAITPMIAHFYKRKFNSLNFFFQIDNASIQEMIDNCIQFNKQSEIEVQAIKTFRNKFKQNYETNAVGRGSNINKQSSSMSSSINFDQQVQESIIIDSQSQNSSQMSMVSHNDEQIVSNFKKQRTSSKNQNKSSQKSIKQSNKSLVSQKYQTSNSASQVNSVIDPKDDNEEENAEQNQQIKEQNKVVDEEEQQQKKMKTFIKYAERNIQIKAFLIVGFIISLFAVYFVCSYILALKAFDNVPEIIDDLEIIYTKDACVENAIAYIRENEILNYTIYLDPEMTSSGKPEIGSTYTLDQCYDLEAQYRDLRKYLPSYFDKAASFMSNIENDMCDYLNLASLSAGECASSFSGLLTIGYSQAIAVILSKFKQVDLLYYSATDRSLQWNIDIIKDIEQINLMEVNEFYLFDIARQLKLAVVDSTLDYFASLRQLYIVLFCVFIILMMFLLLTFLLFTHKSMRFQFVLTNQSFRIIPLENMKKDEMANIKKFCLS